MSEPTVFLSDLARDLGVTPERAGVLVANDGEEERRRFTSGRSVRAGRRGESARGGPEN